MTTRRRAGHRSVCAAALAAGLLFAAAPGAVGAAAYAPRGGGAARAVAADGAYQATLTLADGRRVTVRLVQGAGVQERHRAAGAEHWSRWRTLYATGTDLCQGVGLAARGGTVSLIADFGTYCSDGEPPTESVAGVGTRNLAHWDVDVTEDFDGWERARIAADGSRVVFLRDSDAGRSTLRWRRGAGFSAVQGPAAE